MSFSGEKETYGAVVSKNATTHSYTLQPIISLAGELVGPMYLCLQEMNGGMGEVVKARLFKPDNVVVTCSSSGKLTSSLVTYWRDNCLLPSIPSKCLLLSDTWSAQSDPKLYEKSMCDRKDIVRLEIPWKTTSDLQPLDTFFNRQIKNFIKKVHQRVALDEIDVHMSDRNNIIKLVSLLPRSKTYGRKRPDPANFPRFPEAKFRNRFRAPVPIDFRQIRVSGPY